MEIDSEENEQQPNGDAAAAGSSPADDEPRTKTEDNADGLAPHTPRSKNLAGDFTQAIRISGMEIELPDVVLRTIFLKLDATSLCRCERVNRKWATVAKDTWNKSNAIQKLELSKYFAKGTQESLLKRFGSVMKCFRFSPTVPVKVDIEYLLANFDTFGLFGVTSLIIANFDYEGFEMMQTLFNKFRNLRELVVPSWLGRISAEFPLSLLPMPSWSNLSALHFRGYMDGPAPVFARVHEKSTRYAFAALGQNLKQLHLQLAIRSPVAHEYLHEYISSCCHLTELSLDLDFDGESPALSNDGLLEICNNCANLETIILYDSVALDRETAGIVIGQLAQIKLLWARGDFYFPDVSSQEKKDDAIRLMAAAWCRRF